MTRKVHSLIANLGRYVLFLALCAMANSSRAALLDGKALTVALLHQTTSSEVVNGPSPTVVVGPDVELRDFAADPVFAPVSMHVDIDIADTTITITLLGDQPVVFTEILRFNDPLNTIEGFKAAKIRPESNWAGFMPDRINVTQELIQVDLSGLAGLSGQKLALDVIPEPGTGALTALALAAAVWRRRQG